MRVVVDAHMLGSQEGGNETYVAGLLSGFCRAAVGTSLSVTALVRPGTVVDWISGGCVGAEPLRNSSDVHRLLFGLRSACRRIGPDVLHSTYIAPPRIDCRLALSVHDVTFKSHPSFFSPRDRLLLNALLPASMRRADVVLTLSEASREQLARYYPSSRGKVHVVPLAPGPVADVRPDLEASRRVTGEGGFILVVGTVQPRKNVGRTVEAYALARQRSWLKAKLVVVGRAALGSSQVARMAEASGFTDDIHFAGYQPLPVLAGLYRSCSAFVFPSLVEGFGLPVLEAMACGAPVITSNRPPMSEISDSAALLVDPDSTGEIAGALARVVNDVDLQRELGERGQRRAREFSWERTARETLAVYESALS